MFAHRQWRFVVIDRPKRDIVEYAGLPMAASSMEGFLSSFRRIS
jgi:hypothetical protein